MTRLNERPLTERLPVVVELKPPMAMMLWLLSMSPHGSLKTIAIRPSYGPAPKHLLVSPPVLKRRPVTSPQALLARESSLKPPPERPGWPLDWVSTGIDAPVSN